MCGVCLIDGDKGVWRSNKGSVYHRNRQDTDSSENSSSILQVLSHSQLIWLVMKLVWYPYYSQQSVFDH